MFILAIVLISALLYCVVNLVRWKSCKAYYKRFCERDKRINEYTMPVERLFDKAGTNRVFAVTKYQGEKASQCLSVDSLRFAIDNIFQKTIGVYKYRTKNAFNPVFWLDAPSKLLANFNVKLGKPVDAIFRIVFWAVTVLLAYFLQKFLGDPLFEWISSVCQNIRG